MFAVNLSFLLQLADPRSAELCSVSSHGQQALDMGLHTLRMMAHGGIRDHVGQVRRRRLLCSNNIIIIIMSIYIQ